MSGPDKHRGELIIGLLHQTASIGLDANSQYAVRKLTGLAPVQPGGDGPERNA